MLSDSVAFPDSGGSIQTFELIGRDLVSSKRLLSTTSISEPTYLDITHRSSGKGLDVVNTVEQSVKITKLVNGVSKFATVKLVVSRPVDPTFTDTMIQDALAAIAFASMEQYDDNGISDPSRIVDAMNGGS